MKKMIYVFAAALVATAAMGCPAGAASVAGTSVVAAAKAPKGEVRTVVFSTDLHCQKCVEKINGNLAFEKGVKDLKVDLKTHTITIKYDTAKTSVEKLAAAIKKLGYAATVKE